MAVKIAGGVLSSAILDISQSFSDQEGLILGEVGIRIENEIDDAQIDNRVEVIQYDVKYFVACPNLRAFYNKKGRVLNEKLAELTKGYSCKAVIGWYKSRHNSTHKTSYMEKLVTRNLFQLFSRSRDTHEVMPLFALFTSQHNHNKASIQIEYSFLQQHERSYQTLPVAIQNLGKTMSKYKTESKSHTAASSYQMSLNKHKKLFCGEHNSPESIAKVKLLVGDVDEQLQTVCRQVITSEIEIRELEKEIDQLRTRLCTEISSPAKVVPKSTRVNPSANSENGTGAVDAQLLTAKPASPEMGDLISLGDDVGVNMNNLTRTTKEAKASVTGSSAELNHNQSPTYERQLSDQTLNHIDDDAESKDPSASPVY